MDPDTFAALCAERPAVHRFPGAMAKRLQQVCRVLVDEHGGQASDLWRDAAGGRWFSMRSPEYCCSRSSG